MQSTVCAAPFFGGKRIPLQTNTKKLKETGKNKVFKSDVFNMDIAFILF